MLKLFIYIALLFTTVLAACSSDDPTGPGTPAGTLDVSASTVDFGALAAFRTATRSFTITASADNGGPVSGTVAPPDDDAFTLDAGGGAFTLDPGQNLQVDLRFSPAQAGARYSGTIDLGTSDLAVDCRGFGSSQPEYLFIPTGVSEGDVTTNYRGFADDKVEVDYGGGRSHGESASWLECGSVGTWIFNGNSISESKVTFELDVPEGVDEVEVTLDQEAQRDCVQILVEVDGSESKYDELEGCRLMTYVVPVTPGQRRIAIGTDNALCTGDLEVDSVMFRFRGPVVPQSDWVYR